MVITKKVQGHDVKLELIKIKDYPNYSLYQVYKPVGNKRKPVYRTCLTDLQIQEIILNKNIVIEEIGNYVCN